MALFTESELRQRAKTKIRSEFTKTASSILTEASKDFRSYKTYDIFISHSFLDSEIILGIKLILEDLGYSTYVDWINDPSLDRSNVNKETAEQLRKRLKSSKSLFYVTTENSSYSKWMPWECGYFDGFRSKVAILPVTKFKSYSFSGQEYLSLYPYCESSKSNAGKEVLWIHKDSKTYTTFDEWLRKDEDLITWKT
ncbi:MAG: hypothetical protein WEA56_04505 [Balneolaceae bacterium]